MIYTLLTFMQIGLLLIVLANMIVERKHREIEKRVNKEIDNMIHHNFKPDGKFFGDN